MRVKKAKDLPQTIRYLLAQTEAPTDLAEEDIGAPKEGEATAAIGSVESF